MNKPGRLLLSIALLFFSSISFSQTDSCRLQVSLLTCNPGEELYSSWGHTAIRVMDSTTGVDMVFNYGTFDDTDPDFYLKFTRGIMNYALSAYPYSDFLLEYDYQNRKVIEQVLQLSCADKLKLYQALQINNTGDNRFYSYYFHTDNCTTRARDMIIKNTDGGIEFKNILPQKEVTFRNLIHAYLDYSDHYWSKFGIDLFLGMNLDKKPTNLQSMFLPDYLKTGFDSAVVGKSPLVKSSGVVVEKPDPKPGYAVLTPLVVFTFLLVIIAALSFSQRAWARTTLSVFDSLFFFIIGMLGVMMITLWAIRVDDVCRNNLNVFWALPTHTVIAFLLHTKKQWVRMYFRIVLWISIIMAITWLFLPQQINTAVFPLILLIITRSFHHSKKPR